MMKKLFILFLFCWTSLSAQNSEIFDKGNAAYNEGDYEAAVEHYENILKSGETSAELYYNLGNAYYRLNEIAPSIYYYEKALQLDPGDDDIRNNLSFAQEMVVDDIQTQEESGLTAWWRNTVSVMDYNQWAWTAVVLSFLFAVFFLVYYFSQRSGIKRLFFTLSMVFIALALFSVVFAFQQKSYYTNSDYAIIFAEEAEVRSEPTLRSDAVYRLHEGTKVEILETYQDWVKIELANGAQGWMDKNYIRKL